MVPPVTEEVMLPVLAPLHSTGSTAKFRFITGLPAMVLVAVPVQPCELVTVTGGVLAGKLVEVWWPSFDQANV